MMIRSLGRTRARAFSTAARRLNEVKKPTVSPVKPAAPVKPVKAVEPIKPETVKVQPVEPPKKKWSFRKFFFQATLLAGIAYGGTLYAATKNDKVLDFVIDQQLPYYEEIIELIETGSIDDLKQYFTNLQSKFSSADFKGQINQFTSKGEKIFEETKHKFSGKAEDINLKDATPLQQLQKPVETVPKTIEHLPLVTLSKDLELIADESVKQTVQAFNNLVQSIDIGTQNTPGKETLVKSINNSISGLADKLNSLTTKFDDEIQAKMKDSQTELLSAYTKKELELTENLLDQFNREKTQLEKKLNLRLKNEIDATKETISQAAVNAVTMVRVEQTKNFEKLIKSRIDQERNGRLAGLEQLNERLKELEEFSVSLENQLVVNHNKTTLSKAINNLKHVLTASKEDTANPKLLIEYFDKVNKAASSINDELVTLTLTDLQPLVTKDSSIFTNAQLLSKWEQLTPELRSASLLPPNAGLLGHFASIVFSKLLLPVKGSKPDGKDIESVIGRIESSLVKGELDVAVEEAANLKGWPRKLADDWVKASRKRLEVEFLISILESESRIV